MPMITSGLGHAYHGCAFVYCVYYGYLYLPVFHVPHAPLFIRGLYCFFGVKGGRGMFKESFVCLCTYAGLCGLWGNGLMMSDTMLE